MSTLVWRDVTGFTTPVDGGNYSALYIEVAA